MQTNRILQGHILDKLKEIPSDSISCVFTSPPYWGLRAFRTEPQIWGGKTDCKHHWQEYYQPPKGGMPLKKLTIGYIKQVQAGVHAGSGVGGTGVHSQFCSLCGAWKGELGLEPAPELYIEHLVSCFDEIKRVLRPDGVCFVNIGDSYNSHSVSAKWAKNTPNKKLAKSVIHSEERNNQCLEASRPRKTTLPNKTLCLIPQRFAIAMQQHGWIVRCNIAWVKGMSFAEHKCQHCGRPTRYNGACMPDSTKDRPNKNGWETIWMFTKNKKYFYEPMFEEAAYDGRKDTTLKPTPKYGSRNIGQPQSMERQPMERWPTRDGATLCRRIRNAWAINSRPNKWNYCKVCDTVFQGNVCPKCGANKPGKQLTGHYASFPEELARIIIRIGVPEQICSKCGKPKTSDDCKNCTCKAPVKPGIILDPFMGSGTVAVQAERMSRRWLGIELQKEYVKIAEHRIKLERNRTKLFEFRG